ncbi:hypothetical protein JG731_00490 [Chlamydia gallinacea]|uniref:Uncharacterized protein n=1 Tax=Chlamydia gallinacea TaxID=1457153 RepID=A0ABS7IT71_9CHLA|nr:hypothetical protein [Chlamydia gallinacea]MBX6679844.1 hypothetical protein [Chlamydia gallinacea]
MAKASTACRAVPPDEQPWGNCKKARAAKNNNCVCTDQGHNNRAFILK